jgi:hypothetical protein
LPRDREHDRGQRQHEQPGHHQVRDPPAGQLSDPGDDRDADHVGQGQAAEHEGDALALVAGTHQPTGHQRRRPEVRAVRQRRDEPGQQHQTEAGQQGRGDRAGDHHGHQHQQQRLARQPDRQHREDRGAHHHAQGVRADQPARVRDGRGRVDRVEARQQVAGEVGQQAHGDELGRTDPEPAEGQGQQRQPATGR